MSLEGAKGHWIDDLLEILWSYRTTKISAIDESPFTLTYRSEAVLAVQISMPTA